MKKLMNAVLIDDNDITNFYNEDVLQEADLFDEITILNSGTDAIEYFKKLQSENAKLPDIVFLDIKMPDYNGFEVLEEIEELELENFENMKIFMLTTSTHKRDVEKFDIFTSAVEYIEKPLVLEKVNELVEQYCKDDNI